jgi:YD repeat-containing protein
MGQVRWLRVAFISILLASLGSLFSPAGRTAHQPDRKTARAIITTQSLPPLVAEYHGFIANSAKPAENLHPSNSGGIREQVPDKYTARYQHWKQEFLSTETGRQQWAYYQNNPNFTLTLVITRDNPEGGNTGSYEWNEDGKLVAATITLGCRLDVGVPNPVYFPVMNSLLPAGPTRNIGGETLAATKIAHEFGHVNQTAKVDAVLYKLRVQLTPQYNQIFLSNGRDTSDPRLIEFARRMGATPVEIWEDREYWGETNAMLYLRDRFVDDGFRCLLFSRIKRSLDLYAKGYKERFLNIAQSTPSGHRCGW